MSIKNINRWEPTKTQIYDVILPAYTDMSKKCVSYIRELECPPTIHSRYAKRFSRCNNLFISRNIVKIV